MKKLSTLDESKLFKRLKHAQTDNPTARDQLAGNVRWVVENAQIISSRIVDRLPQYTLHNGTHLFNVLSIMEELLPNETLRQLTPLECALCILAAFTHDLGMVMTDDKVQKYQEKKDTPEHQEWLRHCDAYPEERRQIERWKKIRDRESARASEASRRISYLEGHLLAEFIRKRHADKIDPILHWLDLLQEANNGKLFDYGEFPFKNYLAQIGVSHGQRVAWLREVLVEEEKGRLDSFCHFVGNGERVNFAFPGLLVRLADIMDFDASRAPGILYKHFGIENAVSILEWNKHMAMTGWNLNDKALIYAANACGHPVYEKSIRSFVGIIEHEIKSVKEELHWQRKQLDLDNNDAAYTLRLPEFIQHRIRAARDEKNRPTYIFHDLQFELDQHEIQQLLMGESLYGDPTLCLRELLQNALDALQMRDLRLKVLAKDPDARVEPTDSLRPGEELQIKVTWGRDSATDREFIRVWDNGCGMTKEVLERYFTKLGKSYYRSPEYERERQILREHGFIVSPISQFGIGFLSCFMLADEICLRTHPGRANSGDRAAYNVRLSGSGSLFWLSPGTLEWQGTEITLYLKQPFRLDFDQERDIRWLKAYFRYSAQHDEIQNEWQALEQRKQIDPFLIISRYVIWPLFPILLNPEGNDSQAVRLDDRFHADVLVPIDIEAVTKKAAEWDFSASALGQPRWECLDWQDDQGDDATGTRIRLLFPYHQPTGNPPLPLDPPPASPLMRAHELAALVETTVKSDEDRNRLTVKGIAVDDLKVCAQRLPVAAGVGTKLWIDLRGSATPRLTADRKTALERDDVDDWPSVFRSVFQRWRDKLQAWLDQYPSQLTVSLLSAIAIESKWHLRAPATPSLSIWRLEIAYRSASWVGLWLKTLLLQEITRGRALVRDRALVRALTRVRVRVRDRGPILDHDYTRDRDRALVRALTRVRVPTLKRTLELALELAYAHARVLVRALALDSDLALDNALALDDNLDFKWELSLALHLLSEAFTDDLSHSFPALGVCGLKGRAGDGWLIAPGWIEWDVDPITAEVRKESLKQRWSQPLIEKSYDLVFPLTNVPLGQLRHNCLEWRSHRGFRASGILAYFFLGSERFFKERNQLFYHYLGVPHIHALIPKPELWLKRFDDWTETDWNTCGLSALWDIESGVVYLAEGAHKADDMKQVGKPIESFIASKKKQG